MSKINLKFGRRKSFAVIYCVMFLAILPFVHGKYAKASKQEGINNRNIAQLIKLLESNKEEENQCAVIELHKYGKEAIPYLIDNISNDKKISILLADPSNSDLEGVSFESSVGILSAYIIELILGKESLTKSVPDASGFILGFRSNDYLYRKGIVINEKGETIKKEDLPKIQEIYKAWWGENKNESISILREQRETGSSILNGKNYQWK